MTGAEGPTTPCPFEGCARSFASPNAAAQHVHRSKDHPVDNWEEAREMVEPGADDDDDKRDHDPADNGGDDDDPTVGDASPEDGGRPACYKCGGRNLFDASRQTEYRYGCRDCSDVETWVVFDA